MTVERAQILLKWRGYADDTINAGIALLTPHLDEAGPSDKIKVQCFLETSNCGYEHCGLDHHSCQFLPILPRLIPLLRSFWRDRISSTSSLSEFHDEK